MTYDMIETALDVAFVRVFGARFTNRPLDTETPAPAPMPSHNPIGRPKRIDHEELARLWREGRSCEDIAAAIGSTPLSVQTMASTLRKQGVDLPKRGERFQRKAEAPQ